MGLELPPSHASRALRSRNAATRQRPEQ